MITKMRMCFLSVLIISIVAFVAEMNSFHIKSTNKFNHFFTDDRHAHVISPVKMCSSFSIENLVLIEQNKRGIKKTMKWNKYSNSFHPYSTNDEVKQTPIKNFLIDCFIPSGKISSDYYKYSIWRSAQRFVSATSSVFGTQALLLALGFKSNRIGTKSYRLIYIYLCI